MLSVTSPVVGFFVNSRLKVVASKNFLGVGVSGVPVSLRNLWGGVCAEEEE